MDPIGAAEQFLWYNARLLDRLRFEHLFRRGDGARVVAALAPYQNPDGGFGGALEPDFRGPVSQPTTAEQAVRVLDEVGWLDRGMVGPLCDWLAGVTTPEGGVPMVLSSAADYPRAPWWNPPPEVRASLLPTGGIAGLLHRHRVGHPWLGPATEFCWGALEEVPRRVAAGDWLVQLTYDVRSALLFLDHVPDRARAEEVSAGIGRLLLEAGAVSLDPTTTAEIAMPLDMASTPDTLARHWFDEATLDAHLDALVAGQQDDGGWTIPWAVWTPVTGPEWRSAQTVERLKTLRAYGRL
jgi:hypothetical protein